VDRPAVGGVWEFMTPAFRETYHKGVDITTVPTVACMPLR